MKNLIVYMLSILITIILSIIGYSTYLLWLSTEGTTIEIKEGMLIFKDEE